MEIGLHNYEAFFLDYKEGNLSVELQKELFLFLEKNPHLYEELSAFENVTLDDFCVADVFAGKDSIKRKEFKEEDIIAYTEGIADKETKKEIETLASQNRELKREIALYEAAVVQPDLSIKFKNKDSLKKRGVVITLQSNYTFLRVAAAVLLLVGLFFLISNLNSTGVNEQKVVADKDQSVVKTNQKAVNLVQPSENNPQLAVKNDQATISKEGPKENKEKHKFIAKEDPSNENKNVAVNNVPTPSVISNSPSKEEPVIANNASVKKEQEESPATIKSYYNYRPDADEEETPVVTASAAPSKRSFFQKLVNVARNVNKLGLKNVNASEQGSSNTVSIGSLVVTETTSN